ncbi:MAG TPA: 50S ribosomal protein L24, partial [Dehalococcoidia bacterium]|nr:50S ribosomal protein L24 [Dehalococcoidia bacterium]
MRRIRQDDTVQILTGKDRGQRGPVREVLGQRDRVLVQGVNMVKKHVKAQQIGQPSGIVEIEAPIHISNVAVVCTSCEKASRLGFRMR